MTSFGRISAAILLLILASIFILYPTPEKTGMVVTRLSIVQINASSCNISLSTGWNLISVPCVPFDGQPVAEFLEDASGKYASIHSYNPTDTADPWKSYNPALPNWVIQDLSSISDMKGYWINANDSFNLSIDSTITTPRTIQLISGWNLVGYPTHMQRPVNSSLATLYPYWREIRFWNLSSSAYLTFSNSTQTGDFVNMTHYYGYWIYMTQTQNWVISW